MPRWMRWTLGGGAALLIGIQFIPTSRTNPPVESDISAPPAVKAILRRSCYDCHSNETVWPAYARIAPGSFLISSDVEEGRGKLNFSEWNRRPPAERLQKIGQMLKEIHEGEMPLWFYKPLHPASALSKEDISTLEAWAETEKKTR